MSPTRIGALRLAVTRVHGKLCPALITKGKPFDE